MAIPATAWLWGFTVDDALITARVAAHYAAGVGARFNPHGSVTDAVTPLGYAHFLGLLGSADVLTTFALAKWLGLVSWLVAASVLGGLVAQAGRRPQRFVPLAIVAISAPLAAWAVSGMETGFITLLATLGLLGGASGALCLGWAAAWRPELIPFAGMLVVARLPWRVGPWATTVPQLVLLSAPVLLVAALRFTWFGRVVPLSFYAKPSDFAHGFRYTWGAFAFTGLPWLLLATPHELRRLQRPARPLLAALLAHGAALMLCGGDWMALYRLAVPALPCVALAAAHLAERAGRAPLILRFLLGFAGAALLAVGLGPDARRVGADRARLIAMARPVLAHDERIAALDIGWVGAASDADLLDLAGVSDPQVAYFPGGHTSKEIPAAWLFKRRPTAIVLLLARGARLEKPFEDSHFSRFVEQRVATMVAADFRPRCTLALADQTYLVLEPLPPP